MLTYLPFSRKKKNVGMGKQRKIGVNMVNLKYRHWVKNTLKMHFENMLELKGGVTYDHHYVGGGCSFLSLDLEAPFFAQSPH